METTIHGRENQDTIWLDISETISKEILGLLKYGVMGGWKSQQAVDPPLTDLDAWARRAWRLKGGVTFQNLGQNLFFMGFESVEELDWVMENGSRIFRGEAMHLEWWTPSTGCEERTYQDLEVWIRVFRLLLHMWIEDILKKVGDRCRGFFFLDKETTQRMDLRWARILVKNSSSRKPFSVNLLAGARSYELQIWWEIQPRVVEVYPQGYRTKGLLAEPSEEDEGKSRANGRVRAAKGKRFHISQEMQCVESQQKVLGKCGSGGGVSQRLKCVGISNVGPKQSSESQNNKGIGERKEGAKQVFSRVSKKGHLGLQTGRMAAQNPSPCQGTHAGQSPKRYREQVEWPTVKNATDDHRAKSTGLSVEKTKSIENYSLVSLQLSEDIAGEEKEY